MARKAYSGTNLLKLILQLVRYDIPPLIVGKSSIGKSYTIIKLTEKWRLPHSMLYIGSEKPENIEGLAKLISAEYDSDKDTGKAGEDILKFLKPYWFPNSNTISYQVANGEKIFNDYAKNYYDNPNLKFSYSYQCLHQILIAMMDVNWSQNETKMQVKLVDGGSGNYLSTSASAQALNSKPFTFERTPETSKQAKTAYEETLNVRQAGRDDCRDMCMYLCTLLGYGNYWLILDELDKVDENEQDKYAPLLHIVRERTLKNWTLREISDKKGLDIPLAVSNEYYENIAVSISEQIKKGLPLMDTRVIGIANASKNIEEALFRRFAQLIMEDTMSIYPPAKEANRIKECVENSMPERNLMDIALQSKLEFLSDVNLQWQYSFFPKICNRTDMLGNFFAKDFLEYYNSMVSKYREPQAVMKAVAKNAFDTALGKLFKDNYLGGKDENEQKALLNFFVCLVEKDFLPAIMNEGVDDDGVGDSYVNPIQELREEIEGLVQEEGEDLYFKKLQRELAKDYAKTQQNLPQITNWVNSTLRYIEASNIDASGEYNQLEGVGGRMIPFIYKTIVEQLGSDRIDTDAFNQQMELVERFFSTFLNKGKQGDIHTLTGNEDEVQRVMYGGTPSELKGMPESKKKILGRKSLFGTGNYDFELPEFLDSIGGKIYMTKYFNSELSLFVKTTLSDGNKFKEFRQEASNQDSWQAGYVRFLEYPAIKDEVQAFYDRAKSQPNFKSNRGMLLLKTLLKLN